MKNVHNPAPATAAPNAKSHSELKKIFQKSLKLLDQSESNLKRVKKTLKKAINRIITVTAMPDIDAEMRAVLARLKAAVEDQIDLEAIDIALDELFVLTNRQAAQREQDSGQAGMSSGGAQPFHDTLKSAIADSGLMTIESRYRQQIYAIADSGREDSIIAAELLKLFDNMMAELESSRNEARDISRQVEKFEQRVRHDVFDSIEIAQKASVADILEDLAADLADYVNVQANVQGGVTVEADDSADISDKIVGVVSVLLESMDLVDVDAAEKVEVMRQLGEAGNDTDKLVHGIQRVAGMVNRNIQLLHADKQDLNAFIGTISRQLVDIEAYVRQTQDRHEASVREAGKLHQSLDSSMAHIETEVSDADDIDVLKENVQSHLSHLRENVESHKAQTREMEAGAREDYADMMAELAKSREQTEALKKELEASRQAMLRDTLTGLPNRMAYNERITVEEARYKRSGEPLCLAMWDIDHFKQINDTFGHDAGDKVLKLFSKIIVGRVRKVDMFARLGGEEFVLVMPNTPVDMALALNDKLRESLQAYKFHYEGRDCPVTASVGIAAFADGLDHETVLKQADLALYRSKHGGRNRCSVYDPELDNEG